jgi:myo-inositol catabolism protein IolH
MGTTFAARSSVRPAQSTVRVHQHLDIGQGEVDWPEFFGSLREGKFDGVATVCVFAWEERAPASAEFNLARVVHELEGAPALG